MRDLFSRNARTYDPVNRLISLGQVARWRNELMSLARVGPSDRVLDAFSGPGSLGIIAANHLGPGGELVFADISPTMLRAARRSLRQECARTAWAGSCPWSSFRAVDLLHPPAGLGSFDVVLLGFGLRYAAHPPQALNALAGLLRPGGRLALLDFTPTPLERSARLRGALPRFFFHRLLPPLAGRLGVGREVYDYLSGSTEAFLAESELQELASAAGLRRLASRSYMGGLVLNIVFENEAALA